MKLALSRKVVTWSAHRYESTIDLIFLFKDLIRALTGCKIRKILYYRSDYYLIATYFNLSSNIEPEIKKTCVKKCRSGRSPTSSKGTKI